MKAADLIFDAMKHTSKTPDGRDVPHVTHVLKSVGVSVDFEALAGISGDLAKTIEYRRALGTAVHHDCHALDDLDLDWPAFAEAVGPTVPYVEAWAAFKKNLRLSPVHRERRVFHPVNWFTGTLDGIFAQDNDVTRLILVDIKIGDPDAAGCRYQLSAYREAYLVEHEELRSHLRERWGVQLCPELKVPYRIFNYTDRVAYPDGWQDFVAFQSFCVTYRAQAARRRVA